MLLSPCAMLFFHQLKSENPPLTEKCMRFVRNKRNLARTDRHGRTALIVAAHKHLNVIEALLQAGADPNAADIQGDTALFVAARSSVYGWGIAICLVKHGARIDEINKKGETPLLVASANSNMDMAKFLVEQGADINAVDTKGNTAVQNALKSASNEEFKLARWLIDHGASVECGSIKWLLSLAQCAWYPTFWKGAGALLMYLWEHKLLGDQERRLILAGHAILEAPVRNFHCEYYDSDGYYEDRHVDKGFGYRLFPESPDAPDDKE